MNLVEKEIEVLGTSGNVLLVQIQNIFDLTKFQQVGDNIFSIDIMDRGKGFTSAYLIRGKKLALIDSGSTSCAEDLLAGLQELGIYPADLAYIIVTHIHLDHAGGVGYLAKKLPQLKVLVHEKGAKHLVSCHVQL